MLTNELDLTEERKWMNVNLCEKVISSLKINNINAEYCQYRSEALTRLKALVPENATIGIGDSLTLHEIGLFHWLDDQSTRTVFNPFIRTPQGHNVYSQTERFEIMRKALVSDVFLTSSNAVTIDGKLVNIDCRGNRVAAMLFGPKRTILVIGVNKVVQNVDEGLQRIRNYCAPMNVQRHILKHHLDMFKKLPCAIKGECVDCRSSARICQKTVIIDGQIAFPGFRAPEDLGISVLMVGESLGI